MAQFSNVVAVCSVPSAVNLKEVKGTQSVKERRNQMRYSFCGKIAIYLIIIRDTNLSSISFPTAVSESK